MIKINSVIFQFNLNTSYSFTLKFFTPARYLFGSETSRTSNEQLLSP
jgi:hypothetical protein